MLCHCFLSGHIDIYIYFIIYYCCLLLFIAVCCDIVQYSCSIIMIQLQYSYGIRINKFSYPDTVFYSFYLNIIII